MPLKLVIDANIIFSALIKPHGKTRDLIFLHDFKLYTPDLLWDECNQHEELIRKKQV